MGELAGKSPMGSVLKMLGPRMLADLANVPEDTLAMYLGQLIERLQYVLDGEQPSVALSAVPPLSPVPSVDQAENGTSPSTDR